MGEWRYNIRILNLGIIGVTCSTACHTALYPVSTEEESWSGCSEEMKNILAC
jgi:hypothetical protein